MKFVSYAQNFEDVMLWRALKHVENGFYIDVGANDPTTESVTKAFYERGWSGINIEPVQVHHVDLQNDRPRDINLRCAAGAVRGEIDLWECDVRGWSTADPAVIALHTENGHRGEFHKVELLPLSDICAANVNGEIHFLKIDVEGFEKSVIDGMDFSRFRPWIVVVEATRPNSIEEMHVEWEAVVLASGYALAYIDGLNRFYVANEHAELLPKLRYPPNVFDEYISFHQLYTESRAQHAESRAHRAETRAQLAESRAQQAETKAEIANEWREQFYALQASASWRVTKPLRAIKSMVDGDFSFFDRFTESGRSNSKQPPDAGLAVAPSLLDLKHSPGFDLVVPGEGDRNPGAAPDIDAILERIRLELQKESGK